MFESQEINIIKIEKNFLSVGARKVWKTFITVWQESSFRISGVAKILKNRKFRDHSTVT